MSVSGSSSGVLASFRSLFQRKSKVAAVGDDDLFDDEFQRKLEYLALVSRRVFAGRLRAERRTKKSGSGVEFADHRDYQPGDDFRTLDWSVYQRFEKLLVRLYEEEEDLAIYFILDTSGSMGFGADKAQKAIKLTYAKKVVAALAYVGLANLDRVSIATTSDRVLERMPETRGKARIFKAFRFLAIGPGRGDDRPGRRDEDLRRPEQAAGPRRARQRPLRSRRASSGASTSSATTSSIRSSSTSSIRPTRSPNCSGDVLVYDCETGDEREVTVTAKVLQRFAAAHAEYVAGIERFCATRQVPYVAASVDVPFDELILRVFRRGGFLR